jgi:uncharacterized protein
VLRDELILEGIVTTVDADGAVNIAPMGPYVTAAMKRLVFRPFKSSQTYKNLKVHGEGVFHLTDDVWLLARAAVGRVEPPPMMIPATEVRGYILMESCRFYEFRVNHLDDSQDRTEIWGSVVASGRQRDFFGFNRAKHAVVEAAILATRLHLLPPAQILAEYGKLAVLVEKTGGKQEHKAFQFLEGHVQQALAHQPDAPVAPPTAEAP